MKIFFDGGCRPNPGVIEVAVVARGKLYHRHDVGHGTNNDAEWLALLYALEVAQTLGETDIVLLGDSRMVVDQANGTAKCRSPDLQRHLDAYRTLAPQFPRLRIRYIRRAQNLAGIALDTMRNR